MFGKLSGATIGLYNFLRAVPGLHVDPELVATTAGADGVAFTGKLDATELRMKLEDGELHGTVLAKLERPFADGDRRITVIGIYR